MAMEPSEANPSGHLLMKVDKYIPTGMYGFLTGEDLRLYFHLEVFDPGPYGGQEPVPPVVGEVVEAHLPADGSNRAKRVNRIKEPLSIEACVDWFDDIMGYGFAKCANQNKYYLHRSEILEGRLPVAGRRVSFYVPNGSNRACHIRVESSL